MPDLTSENREQYERGMALVNTWRGMFNTFACRPCWFKGHIVEFGLSQQATKALTTNKATLTCHECKHENIFISTFFDHYEQRWRPTGNSFWIPTYQKGVMDYVLQIKKLIKLRDIPNDEQKYLRILTEPFTLPGDVCRICSQRKVYPELSCELHPDYKCNVKGCQCDRCKVEFVCPCKLCKKEREDAIPKA